MLISQDGQQDYFLQLLVKMSHNQQVDLILTVIQSLLITLQQLLYLQTLFHQGRLGLLG